MVTIWDGRKNYSKKICIHAQRKDSQRNFAFAYESVALLQETCMWLQRKQKLPQENWCLNAKKNWIPSRNFAFAKFAKLTSHSFMKALHSSEAKFPPRMFAFVHKKDAFFWETLQLLTRKVCPRNFAFLTKVLYFPKKLCLKTFCFPLKNIACACFAKVGLRNFLFARKSFAFLCKSLQETFNLLSRNKKVSQETFRPKVLQTAAKFLGGMQNFWK